LRRGGLRRNHLSGRRSALNVRQEAELLVGLVEVLEVRGPRSVENSLSLPLLLLTNVEEEAGLLLTELLSHGTQTRLIHAQLLAGLSRLNPQLPVLSAKTANALSDLGSLLRALKPQPACCFGACHAHLGLGLPKLAVLLRHLARELFCGHAELRCALGNVCLSRGAGHAELPCLLGKLPRELGGVHAGGGGKLLDVHARLRLGLSIGCRKLLSGEPRPSRHFGAREPKLTRLKGSGLRKLLCRKAELPRGLCGLLTLRRKRLSVSRGLVGSREAKLTRLKAAALGKLLSR
jgi:hypothetical protein